MRPLPSEVISGIRALLADVVAPELTSAHAQSRLAEARAVLAQIDWDDAGFDLIRRCAVLRDVLVAAGSWVPAPIPPAPEHSTFAAYAEYHEDLLRVAEDTLVLLRERLRRDPADHAAASLRRALLEAV